MRLPHCRSHVVGAAIRPTSRPPGRYRKQADRAEARPAQKYFALACRLIRPAPPVLLDRRLVGHRQVTALRTLAPELAPAPGAIVLRSDVERKASKGRREDERLPPHATPRRARHASTPMLVEKAGASSPRVTRLVDARIRSATGARTRCKNVAQARGVTFHGLFSRPIWRPRARFGRVGEMPRMPTEPSRGLQERLCARTNDWRSIDASGVPGCTLARARNSWRNA